MTPRTITALTFVAIAAIGAAMFAVGCDGVERRRDRHASRNASFEMSQSQSGDDSPLRGNDPEYGQALYGTTCITCHGAQGHGVPRQGVNIRASKFIEAHSNEEIVAFLRIGRPINDPKNSSGLLMPPRGGNAALDDTSLGNIVAFLRQMQQAAKDELAEAPTTQPIATIAPAPSVAN